MPDKEIKEDYPAPKENGSPQCEDDLSIFPDNAISDSAGHDKPDSLNIRKDDTPAVEPIDRAKKTSKSRGLLGKFHLNFSKLPIKHFSKLSLKKTKGDTGKKEDKKKAIPKMPAKRLRVMSLVIIAILLAGGAASWGVASKNITLPFFKTQDGKGKKTKKKTAASRKKGAPRQGVSMEQTPKTVQSPEVKTAVDKDINDINKEINKYDIEEVIKKYTQLIDTSSNEASVYFNIGNAFFLNHQIEEALIHYKKAIELDPNILMAKDNFKVLEEYLEIAGIQTNERAH
ncbi:tetratricopeptide repeat protein [bacterium]|nr:tetratricopeptide repeat protein [bacterium]